MKVQLQACPCPTSLPVSPMRPRNISPGGRLGFGAELPAMALLPIASLIVLFFLAKLVGACAPPDHRRPLTDWPQVWDVEVTGKARGRHREGTGKAPGSCQKPPPRQVWDCAVWMMLIQYSTISRKMLAIFDCVPYMDGHLLRSDPVLQCYDASWVGGAVLSVGGIVVYCLGLPAVSYLLSRWHHHSHSSARRRLVQVSSLPQSGLYPQSCGGLLLSPPAVRTFPAIVLLCMRCAAPCAAGAHARLP